MVSKWLIMVGIMINKWLIMINKPSKVAKLFGGGEEDASKA
jgi:hypothetical protein